MGTTRTISLSVVAMLPMAGPLVAAPLNFVNVSAPGINCIFNATCTVTVTDTVDTITVPPGLWTGNARLQSRTFAGASGTPGAGKTAYEYRVDLTQVVSGGEVPCVTDIAVDFGPVTKLQYNKAGPLDDVYVVTKGALGSVGLYAVDKTGDAITFTFNEPACAGPTPGTGATSCFFGLASTNPPKFIVAYASVPGLLPIDVKARAELEPARSAAGTAAGSGARQIDRRNCASGIGFAHDSA
jgi:hypothetical protein